jgi:hypothetical protein
VLFRSLTVSSLETAIGEAIGTSNPAWLLLFQHPDYESAASIIQLGGYGGEYLPDDTDETCDCSEYSDATAIPGSGTYCNTFSALNQFPESGYLELNTWYESPNRCCDLGYGGCVSRIRLYAADGVTKVSSTCKIRMTGHTTSGINTTAYPYALAGFNEAGSATFLVSHADFVNGQEYDAGDVWGLEWYSGAGTGQTREFLIESN